MLLGSAQMAITSLHFAWGLKADLLSLTCRSPRSLAHRSKGNMSKTPEGVQAAFFNELQPHCLCDLCERPEGTRRDVLFTAADRADWRHGLAGLIEPWGPKLLSHQARTAHQRQRVTNSMSLENISTAPQTELEPLFGKGSRYGTE
jgi:hypothetical protein